MSVDTRRSETHNVRKHGAVADGTVFDTEAFQGAIGACAQAGGGTVLVPPGRYHVGPFELLSHVRLHLEAGAVLLASTNMEDYFESHTSIENPRIGLIYARKAENVAITGTGTIDCRGLAFMDMTRIHFQKPEFERKYTRQGEAYLPMNAGGEIGDGPVQTLDRPGDMLQFLECTGVRLRDITIVNAPYWTVHCGDSRDIVVSGITIKNDLLIPNSDGIHCTTCRHVRISDCSIQGGDDCLAFTTFGKPGGWTEDVVVTNCTLASRSSGVRIGYGPNDFRNCVFQNLTIESNRGIGVFTRWPGSVRNVLFDTVVIRTRLHTGNWWGHGEPIHISAIPEMDVDRPGTIENISFSNITAESEAGILVYGCDKGFISDVDFDRVRLTISRSPLAEPYGGNTDLRPTNDMATALFASDEHGFFARNVEGLRLHDFRLRWDGELPDYMVHGAACEGCADVDIQNYNGRAPHDKESSKALDLTACERTSVVNSTP